MRTTGADSGERGEMIRKRREKYQQDGWGRGSGAQVTTAGSVQQHFLDSAGGDRS